MPVSTLLYIGRFQPFHNGHQRTLEFALSKAKNVVIGLGSCNAKRSAKNPWSEGDRENMIRYSMGYGFANRLHFVHLWDYPESHECWANRVRAHMEPWEPWGIVGVRKDASTFYLDLFPERQVLCPDNIEVMDATTVRKKLFVPGTENLDAIRGMVPRGTEEVLEDYITSEAFKFACRGMYV